MRKNEHKYTVAAKKKGRFSSKIFEKSGNFSSCYGMYVLDLDFIFVCILAVSSVVN